jgi:WD40 repeat protein
VLAHACCFASVRGCPLALWDAYSGALRAGYTTLDRAEEPADLYSVAFSADGERLYAGADRGVFVADVERPAERSTFLATCGPRRARAPGLRGLVSALHGRPGAPTQFVAGSFGGAVALFDERSGSRDRAAHGAAVVVLAAAALVAHAHVRGVSQLAFDPSGAKLYSGGRKDSAGVLCWDLRRADRPLTAFPRLAATHQRISFDVDGRWLATGCSSGRALVYDAARPGSDPPVFLSPHMGDAVNSASLRSARLEDGRSMLALATGQRARDDADDDQPGPPAAAPALPPRLALLAF